MVKEVSESCVDSLLTEMVSCYCNRFYANKPELAARRIEAIGYQVGQQLSERYTMERPRFSDHLEAIKFICKDFWSEVFKKQIDNLKTNHRGTFVLQDNKFPWLTRMSVDPSADNVSAVEDYSAPTAESKAAQAMSMHLYFPCGIIRGALSNLGIPCAVSADIANLPACAVGIPYKEEVVRFCDEVHPLAQSIGAVNTIIRRPSDGKLIGYNTDCEASITAIEDALIEHGCNDGGASSDSPIAGRLFVLVGAGGAGKALAFGAKSRGARVVIFDIDFDRAKSLACAVFGEVMPYKDLVNFQPEKGAILANATPIGMHPSTDRIPVAEATLGDYRLVFDAVYTPRRTRLLKEVDAAGAITGSGVEMFLRQAAGQFNLFTGLTAPEEFMREIVIQVLMVLLP